jgi:hypothetical protein
MLPGRMYSALAASHGIWTDTVGLIFTFFVILPVLATALIVVAMVSGRGEREADAELRARWGRKRRDGDGR